MILVYIHCLYIPRNSWIKSHIIISYAYLKVVNDYAICSWRITTKEKTVTCFDVAPTLNHNSASIALRLFLHTVWSHSGDKCGHSWVFNTSQTVPGFHNLETCSSHLEAMLAPLWVVGLDALPTSPSLLPVLFPADAVITWQDPHSRTSYDISQASDWSWWTSRPIRSLRYIVTCTRMRSRGQPVSMPCPVPASGHACLHKQSPADTGRWPGDWLMLG